MPTNQSPSLRALYQECDDAYLRRQSAISLAEAILAAPDVVPAHRRELLSITLWKYTEADGGKCGTRYRSTAVVHGPTTSIQHEHVITRASLVDRLLEPGCDAASVLSDAPLSFVVPLPT